MPIHQSDRFWVLETKNTAYALGINERGQLIHSYWGARLPCVDDYPAIPPISAYEGPSFDPPESQPLQEYPAYAGVFYREPSLKLTYADGVRDTVLAYDSATLNSTGLTIHLRDTHYRLTVSLYYRIHEEYDLMERFAEVCNAGTEAVNLERVWSARWQLPWGGEYRLSHLSGRWLDEMHLTREPLTPGVKTLESRRLTTSHGHNPWFAVDRGAADEETGEVWFGVLAWSGNWKMTAENDHFAVTSVSIGLNDWDFAWKLNAGETFQTPVSYAGYTQSGFGAASRSLHDFIRDTVLPHGKVAHKVLYNSWEATFFDVDERSQAELAEMAAEMGVELFVMDDGWFPKRHSDNAGLGDWWPDPEKFPNGLGPLVERVNALGMEFGLWLEPEMVNPDSDLYRAHPDWVIHFPTRERSEARNQLILNLARTDVQEYLIGLIDRLLTENKIAFIKWDMNRNASEPGWETAPGDPRELWVRYVRGVYHVWGTLRERHPHVIWQSCSGGGGRADLAILRLADQIWTSDNTEPAARLRIQEGFSQIFPANTMEAWVTDMGAATIPLEFRMHVSMCGSLGIGGHLVHWGPERRGEAAHWIAVYKEIRDTVQFGDQHRLRSPQEHAFSAVQYVSKDLADGVLFAFRTHISELTEIPYLKLRGLDPQARYTVEGFEGARSGAAWMAHGLQIKLKDFGSTVRRIRRVGTGD